MSGRSCAVEVPPDGVEVLSCNCRRHPVSIVHADSSSVREVLFLLFGQDNCQLLDFGLCGRRYIKHGHQPRRLGNSLVTHYAFAVTAARRSACAV